MKYTLRSPLLLNTVGFSQACAGFRGDALSLRSINTTADIDDMLLDMISSDIGYKGLPNDIEVLPMVALTIGTECVIYVPIVFPGKKSTRVHIVPVTDEVSERSVGILMPPGVPTYAMNTIDDRFLVVNPGVGVSVKAGGSVVPGLWCGRCTMSIECTKRATPNPASIKDIPEPAVMVEQFKLLKANEGTLKRLKAIIVEREGDIIDPSIVVRTSIASNLHDPQGLVNKLVKDKLLDKKLVFPGMPTTLTYFASVLQTGESSKKNSDLLKSTYSEFFTPAERKSVTVKP